MGLHGIDIGAVEQRLVDGGIVFGDALDEFVLANHDASAMRYGGVMVERQAPNEVRPAG